MAKLQAKVSQELNRVIGSVCVVREINKAEALEYLIDLALENPKYPIQRFGDGQEKNCSLIFSKARYEQTKNYRDLHGLAKKTQFLRDALARGASYYLDRVKPAGR
jgi:hypothetical protein